MKKLTTKIIIVSVIILSITLLFFVNKNPFQEGIEMDVSNNTFNKIYDASYSQFLAKPILKSYL